MSTPLSAAARIELREQFFEKRELQFGLQDEHEKSGAHGLAYLAVWAVLETFAKQLCAAQEREKLIADLLKWVEFMNDVQVIRPSEIATAKYKPDTFLNGPIPSKKQLTLLISAKQAPSFHFMLDPDQKYRKRRNAIAHTGDSVSAKVYEEFKVQAVIAFQEIEAWLLLGDGNTS